MPGEAKAQYRRNRARDAASVAAARVSVRKMEASSSTGSARSVQAILTKARLAESGELVGGQGMERDVRLPGPGDGPDHEFHVGHLGENAPSHRESGRHQAAGPWTGVRRGAEDDLPGPEDRAHERLLQQILVARRGEGDGSRRRDPHVVALDDLVGRHESIEQAVSFQGPG